MASLFRQNGTVLTISCNDLGNYKRKGKKGRIALPDKKNLDICLDCPFTNCDGDCQRINEKKD